MIPIPARVRSLLVALAAVCFVVAVLLAFALIGEHSAARIDDAIGWTGLGLALYAVAAI